MHKPKVEALAGLIRDLTQGTSIAPCPEQLTQPILDVASVVATSEFNPLPPVATPPTEPEDKLDETILAQLDQLLAEPPVNSDIAGSERPSDSWFLGIDIGTTGISAVLLNQAQHQLYPIYWQSIASAASLTHNQKKFRLPTAVTLIPAGPSAAPLPTIRLEPNDANSPRLSLMDWKPFLKLAVPHHSPQTTQWEPILQWSHQQTVPLRTIQEALQHLLATLNPDRASFMPALTCGALGLDAAAFQTILRHLTGVVVGYPSNWSDTYSFNVREAILQAELVNRPDQILLIEDAIATLLSALPAGDGRSIKLADQAAQRAGQHGHLHNAQWRGMTLILTAGASLTELVLVNLPPQSSHLNHTDFYVRSLPYAGQGIDQDIISQLLYPRLTQLAANPVQEDSAAARPVETETEINSYDFSLDLAALSELERLAPMLTTAVELDDAKRSALRQQLLSSTLGQQLLMAARALKITLHQQNFFTLKFGTHQLAFQRQELTSQILLPYVQRLNRELNTLLAQTNTTAVSINQVVCTGGTASLGAIARWLRQKLPNATIVQDNYPAPASVSDSYSPSCSRVAYGLATLPLHPQVLDIARHQANDYFLLRELLRSLPQQPIGVETVMQILQQKGIDTPACRFRILALLEGHLPPGLVPTAADLALLTPESAANPDYQAVQLAPLLTKQADRTYEPNRHVWDYLQHYLETLLADTEQTLSQPLALMLTPLLYPDS